MTRCFRIGAWEVRPELGMITRGENTNRLEPKVMEVLVYLAERAGGVLPKGKDHSSSMDRSVRH
jgi:DNA-binding winged helix-turn-helix (wHTH) protein